MKNELESLEQTFFDQSTFFFSMQKAFASDSWVTGGFFSVGISKELDRVKNVINSETLNLLENEKIRIYIEQYLRRLDNFLIRFTAVEAEHEEKWNIKLKELETQNKSSFGDQVETIEYQSCIVFSESKLLIVNLIINLIREYGYLFESLNWNDKTGLIISSVKDSNSVNSTHKITKIRWNKSSKDFVKLFHHLIQNNSIQFENSSNTKPIVEQLHKFFEIEKDRGKGTLELESLITYFKKENTGETY